MVLPSFFGTIYPDIAGAAEAASSKPLGVYRPDSTILAKHLTHYEFYDKIII